MNNITLDNLASLIAVTLIGIILMVLNAFVTDIVRQTIQDTSFETRCQKHNRIDAVWLAVNVIILVGIAAAFYFLCD